MQIDTVDGWVRQRDRESDSLIDRQIDRSIDRMLLGYITLLMTAACLQTMNMS